MGIYVEKFSNLHNKLMADFKENNKTDRYTFTLHDFFAQLNTKITEGPVRFYKLTYC